MLPYDKVARDEPPERDDIGVGMEILFPQGDYFCNACGVKHLRYFEGEITNITQQCGQHGEEVSDFLLDEKIKRSRPQK